MIKAFFGNLRLNVKIALVCLALVVPGVIVPSTLYYRYASDSAIDTIHLNNEEMSRQMTSFFDTRMTNILKKLIAMLDNPSFGTILRDYLVKDDPVSTSVALSTLSSWLSEFKSSDDFIASELLVTPKMVFYDFVDQLVRGFEFSRTSFYQDFQDHLGPGLYWGTNQADSIFRGGRRVIPLALRFTVPDYGRELTIVVNLDAEAIRRFLAQSRLPEDRILLVDQSRRVVAGSGSPVEQLVLDKLRAGPIGVSGIEDRQARDRYLVTSHDLKVAPWTMVNIGSTGALERRMERLREFTWILILGFGTLGVVLSLLLASGITRPIAALEKSMTLVGDRVPESRFSYPYRDEVGRLGRSFNAMVDQIDALVGRLNLTIRDLEAERERVRDEQVRKRRAELMALQAQINPHFLYNTLNTIVWMANRAKTPDIGHLASELGTFFRIALSNGVETIRLADEAAHVRSYLEVQRFRYGETIHYRLDLDPGVADAATLKLIVQPLVENAIYHGIKAADRPGEILVVMTPAGDGSLVEIVVEDNGVGIETLALAKINHRLETLCTSDEGGYGIYNVNERIRLAYGPGSGLRYEPRPGGGTRATIQFPRTVREGP